MPDLQHRVDTESVGDLARGPDISEGAVSDQWFGRTACRNCGTAMTSAYCGACGQKAAQRFVWRDIRTETWDRLRLFELKAVRTLRRLVVAPGTVARDYVLGRRATYMHPLKLLVATVAMLVLVLAGSQYFSVYADLDRDAVVKRMAGQVLAFSNWSFSLGIVAIVAAARLTFRERLGYNLIEVMVLAIYCQSVVLAFISVNLLPTLIWHDPAFILTHKAASQIYIPVLKTLVVAIAYRQFYLLSWRSDWPRLLLACMIFVAINWALLRLYAWAILWLVSR
ncbi:DUF3667 domain-containing protein [Sphingomonas sp. PB4P5]|uniref:DUF3667 domain-containing protein n=1 Tax=Parasphingomonas puruogangriensis TaxID=3096155 RepID=UPI002FCA0E78